MLPWLVGPCFLNVEGSYLLNMTLRCSHDIGAKGINNVQVELYDFNCEEVQEKNNSTNAVRIVQEAKDSSLFNYSADFFQNNAPGFTGGFDHPNNDGTGAVKFCTRVSTWTGSILVAFYETNFVLNYDMSDNGFSILNIEIAENDPNSFVTDLLDDYSVEICQCNNFLCLNSDDPKSLIQQDDNLVVCLEPKHPGGQESLVQISNFNLNLVAGEGITYVEYIPVWFNTTGWAHDVLTSVEEQPNGGNIIMVTTPVVAQFFIQGHNRLNVSGNCFLQLVGSKIEKEPVFSAYNMLIDIKVEDQGGCLQKLMKNVQKIFKVDMETIFPDFPEVNLALPAQDFISETENKVETAIETAQDAVGTATQTVQSAADSAVNAVKNIFLKVSPGGR